MNYCEFCLFSIEDCLNLLKERKCCPECVCAEIDAGINELDKKNEQLISQMSEDGLDDF